MSRAFVSGLLSGLCTPSLLIRPRPIETRIDPLILKPSYRPASEDVKHIRSYFSKAVDNCVPKKTTRQACRK